MRLEYDPLLRYSREQDALVPLCGWQPVTKLPITPENVYRMIRAGRG
jgi:hypothetical protein